jgi:hypothetical protein
VTRDHRARSGPPPEVQIALHLGDLLLVSARLARAEWAAPRQLCQAEVTEVQGAGPMLALVRNEPLRLTHSVHDRFIGRGCRRLNSRLFSY